MSQKQTNNHDYKTVTKRKSYINEKIQRVIKQSSRFSQNLMWKIKGNNNNKRCSPEKGEKCDSDTYYVVRKGKRPGLYQDLAQALEQVEEFPHGQMKKVEGYKNALAYMQGNLPYSNKLENKNDSPTIYIDGSYVQDISVSGYGYIAVQNGRVIQRDFGIITDSDMIHLQSIGAEITALIRAMEWAIANNYQSINIVYDATAIISLTENNTDEKGLRSKGKVKFKDIYDTYIPYIAIHYIHRNEDELFKKFHEEAHHLSRLPYDMLTGRRKD